MLKDYQTLKTRAEYDSTEAVSASLLKEVEFNPKVLISGMPKRTTSFFNLGLAVDTALLDFGDTPQEDTYENKFYVTDLPAVSESVLRAANLLMVAGINKPNSEDILKICNTLNYQPNWKDETRVKKISVDLLPYYKELIKSEGKTILTSQEDDLVNQAVMLGKTHPWTKEYFTENQRGEVELVSHFRILTKYENLLCKAELDLVKANHKLKLLTPVDVKTGEDNFMSQYYRSKYYIQGCFYKELLTKFARTTPEFKDYRITPFKFIFFYMPKLSHPTIYKMTEEMHLQAYAGWRDISGRLSLGVGELIDDLKWYKELLEKNPQLTDLVPKYLEENRGEITITGPPMLPY